MTQQPEALRLAEESAMLTPILAGIIEGPAGDPAEIYRPGYVPVDGDCYVGRAAQVLDLQAAELRRQHAEIARLREAIWKLLDEVDKVRSAPRSDEDWQPLNVADDELRALIDKEGDK